MREWAQARYAGRTRDQAEPGCGHPEAGVGTSFWKITLGPSDVLYRRRLIAT
jgi:hypothetical protein